ncbi:hypothetical protein [Allosphingosinicella sp.]|uniref:hypothetical protein n=1 Tax=Allosphingosinicella sp. TaxID=2823234 RepID=UPI002FC17110
MRRMRVIALLLTAAGLSACTSYYGDYAYGPGYYHGDRVGWDDFDQYGDYRYDGDYYEPARWQDREAYLIGAGVEQLDPWLALTPEGRDIVTLGFDTDDDGWIAEGTAERANIWFRRYADTDDDRRLTDPEIRVALVQGSRDRPWIPGGY